MTNTFSPKSKVKYKTFKHIHTNVSTERHGRENKLQLQSNEGWAVKTFKSNKSVNSYDKGLYLKKKMFHIEFRKKKLRLFLC